MKIRIKGNSIRYRLTQTDITDLGKLGSLEERTEFPDGTVLRYRLQSNSSIDHLEAGFEKDCISVYVPEQMVREWVSTEVVGFDHTIALNNGRKLFLLIEKDFVCLDHTIEDQSDNYPNPNRL